MADKDRKAEARRTKIAVFIDETIVSSQEKRERVEREMAEMKRQDERDIDEFRVQGQRRLVAQRLEQERVLQHRALVVRHQRTGKADAG